MDNRDICVLCKANPARECDCSKNEGIDISVLRPKVPALIDELDDIDLQGTWDIHYTSVDKEYHTDSRPRCLVRSDGMMVYATLVNGEKTYSRWGVGRVHRRANPRRLSGRHISPSGYFDTAKEAMQWVDENVIEKPNI